MSHYKSLAVSIWKSVVQTVQTVVVVVKSMSQSQRQSVYFLLVETVGWLFVSHLPPPGWSRKRFYSFLCQLHSIFIRKAVSSRGLVQVMWYFKKKEAAIYYFLISRQHSNKNQQWARYILFYPPTVQNGSSCTLLTFWFKNSLRPPWGVWKLIFTKLINIVSLERCHHCCGQLYIIIPINCKTILCALHEVRILISSIKTVNYCYLPQIIEHISTFLDKIYANNATYNGSWQWIAIFIFGEVYN